MSAALLVSDEQARELKKEAVHLPSWDVGPRQIWDLELLMSGAFAPLKGYLGRADYESVCENMRLADGSLWPMPIVLDVTEEMAGQLSEGSRVALRHPEGMVLAVLTVEEIWTPDRNAEADCVLGTTDTEHPGVFALLHQTNPVYVGGRIEGVELPPHHTFRHLRRTPDELKAEFARLGWSRVVAFQTRNPMHRAHIELARRAAAQIEGNLLIHPVVGMTKPGDVDYFTRVRCYEAVVKHTPANLAMVSLLPLAMRMGGPREAVWHALIRKNHGCTHFIIGRDHAGPKKSNGQSFYGPYDAQQLAMKHSEEM
ncbi:MAG TPA: sulfate adenylyltransferase, partial [Longimicrobiales bacterium]|nr:sulfate adenylyltransferase [Longimicrobiales bacterium]